MGNLTDHFAEEVFTCEWPCGVMHANDRRVRRDCGKTVANRLTPRLPASDSTLAVSVLGRYNDDDPVTHRLCSVDGPVEDPLVGDQCVLLLTAESGT